MPTSTCTAQIHMYIIPIYVFMIYASANNDNDNNTSNYINLANLANTNLI